MFEHVAIDPQFDLRELCNVACFWQWRLYDPDASRSKELRMSKRLTRDGMMTLSLTVVLNMRDD